MKPQADILSTEKTRKVGEALPPVFVDDILMSLKYYVDEEQAHLYIKDPAECLICVGKGCTFFCPVGVYTWQNNKIEVAFQSCIECGSCRIRCERDNIAWKNPRGGFGVAYKFG